MISRRHKFYLLTILALALVFASVYAVYAWTSVPVVDDPLVRMPGTQPGQVALQAPTRCMNCHAGYNTEVEPGFNWRGSMMANAARDPYWQAGVRREVTDHPMHRAAIEQDIH